MIAKETVLKIAEDKLLGTDNYIVDITITANNKITVLLDNDLGISINECVALSRYIESNLDRTIEDFELNVMSPGLIEPFKIIRQYKKNIGREVSSVTKENQKYTGKLISVDDEGIVIEIKSKEKTENNKGKQLLIKNINLTFNQLKETKIVLSF